MQAALGAAARKAHPSLGATRSARSPYPLVGLVKCGVCHGNFSVDRRHNGAGRMCEDYVCGRRKDLGKSVCGNTVRVSRAELDRRILVLVTHRLVDPTIRETLRTRLEALRARTAEAAQASGPAIEKALTRIEGKIRTYLERLALLPPEAARLVGGHLEQLGTEKQQIRVRLQAAENLDRAANAFLVALGAGPRLLVPSPHPTRRARILGRATARVLADLEDSAPETVRTRLKATVRQITVNADGNVTVEGTHEPFVVEALAGAERPDGSAAEAVRRMLVPGGRTHNGANRYIPTRSTLEDHFSRRRLARQENASVELLGLDAGSMRTRGEGSDECVASNADVEGPVHRVFLPSDLNC